MLLLYQCDLIESLLTLKLVNRIALRTCIIIGWFKGPIKKNEKNQWGADAFSSLFILYVAT